MTIGKTIAIIVGAAALIAIPVTQYITYANMGNRLENGIIAQYKENQNTLTKLSNSVMEAAQVPEMAKNNLKEVIESAMQGRYGAGGSKAFVQAITENYPGSIDPSLYVKLQQLIESGRADFRSEQSKLIDKVRVYKTETGYVWSGFWLSLAGYPKIDFDKYDIVISDYTDNAFQTKRDNGLKLGK